MPQEIFAGWGEQTVYSTLVARTQFGRVYPESDLKHDIPREPYTYLGNPDPDELFDGVAKGSGVIIPVPVYDGMGKLLKHALGAFADAGAGPYTHTFTLASAAPAFGLSVELHKAFSDSGFESKLATGAKVSEFSIECAVGQEVKFPFTLVAEQVALGPKTASPTYPTYTGATGVIIKPSQITVQIDAASADVSAFNISVNGGIDDTKAFLGDAYIREPARDNLRVITGEISKEWSSKALYDKFISGATAELLATCDGPGNHDMTIRVAKLIFREPTEELTTATQIPQGLPFVAVADATYTALQIVETNDTATT